jgi:hypothetical protein
MNEKNFFWVVAAAFATCMLSTSPAFAASGWSVGEHITSIEVVSSYNGALITPDSTVYNDNCPGSPGTYFLPDDAASPANPKYKSQLALLMAAYVEGKTLNFYIYNCSSNYSGYPAGYPVITIVQLNS